MYINVYTTAFMYFDKFYLMTAAGRRNMQKFVLKQSESRST